MGKSCKVSKRSLLCVFLVLVSVATFVVWLVVIIKDSKDDTPAWDRYRLPKTLVPEFYNVTLWPRLQPDPDSGLYIFTGWSTVQFLCVEATNLILIHSNKLNYTKMDDTQLARLTAEGGASAPRIKSTWLQLQTQYLVIELKDKLISGQSYQLHTRFAGELADDLVGFYRSEYNEDGVKRIIAISQMHPTHSRKTFPCFDEPAMKAVFHLTLIHPPGTVALSNGMETDVLHTTFDGEAVTQTRFEATEKMSTYLLAIVVSNYTYLNTTQGDTLRDDEDVDA